MWGEGGGGLEEFEEVSDVFLFKKEGARGVEWGFGGGEVLKREGCFWCGDWLVFFFRGQRRVFFEKCFSEE